MGCLALLLLFGACLIFGWMPVAIFFIMLAYLFGLRDYLKESKK